MKLFANINKIKRGTGQHLTFTAQDRFIDFSNAEIYPEGTFAAIRDNTLRNIYVTTKAFSAIAAILAAAPNTGGYHDIR